MRSPGIPRCNGRIQVFLVFALVFLVQMPLALQSLDLTDQGWHLANQADLFSDGPSIEDIEWQFILSQWVGGLWLRLAGGPSVAWSRAGGVLLLAANSALVFSLLRNHFGGRRAILPLIATALFVAGTTRSPYISYYTFPALLVNLELWLLDRVLFGTGRRELLYGLALGLVCPLVALSRTPLVIAVLIPLLAAIYLYARDSGDRASLHRARTILGTYPAGFVCSSVVILIAMASVGAAGPYFSNVTRAVSGESLPEHGSSYMVQRYLVDATRMLLRAAIIIVTYLAFLLAATAGERIGVETVARIPGGGRTVSLLAIAAVALGMVCCLVVLDNLHLINLPGSLDEIARVDWRRDLTLAVISLVSVLSLVVLLVGNGGGNADGVGGEGSRLDALVLCGAVAMVIAPLGSNTGLFKAVYGLWLILPLSYLRAQDIGREHPWRVLRMGLGKLEKGLIPFLFISLWLVATGIYRDNPSRLELDVAFTHPSLKGIYSTAERVKAVEEVLGIIEENASPGEEILIINSAPILYYLTGTRPATGEPWLFLCDIETIRERQGRIGENDRWPKIFCYSEKNTRDWGWPNTVEELSGRDLEKLRYMVGIYSANPIYSEVYRGEVFTVLLRSDEGCVGFKEV